MELVSCERRLQKLINKTTFKHCTRYSDTLSAVTLENKIIKFDKPIYIGFTVLNISKTLMYDYHYNVMQRHYGEHIKLMYTDTDSLVYHIITDEFYTDLLENPNLMDRLDTADLPSNHPCYTTARTKVPGFFSDESKGDIISEFCALRAKSYAYKIHSSNTADTVERESIKANSPKRLRVRRHVVKNHTTLEDHRKCLFGEAGVKAYQENVSIRSFKHKLLTIRTNKLTRDEPEVWPELEFQLNPEGQPWTDADKEIAKMLLRCLMEYLVQSSLNGRTVGPWASFPNLGFTYRYLKATFSFFPSIKIKYIILAGIWVKRIAGQMADGPVLGTFFVKSVSYCELISKISLSVNFLTLFDVVGATWVLRLIGMVFESASTLCSHSGKTHKLNDLTYGC
ncbi:hypothetical protein AGLY_008721 [Aphis glycines]|uniref:DNA-directed DNA polymerase n=1 Tax=Aphis glycines TaxID=307491 RepID=A0A6G0TK95_APHGL|nr:hypothetical protein AGLY_008721 [Aphis glycines]